ncbi:competence type IV pilus minor pilin ComGF [Clostridium sp.]|uniref:competence type IV pilus minor pilin ComGF n=1 Tax=Clostridium sp. TaxID=1506 RepID=UPI002633B0D1|nr:competence type IV pilus minor pilin ComGF [Clostridium sp.]
MKYKKRRGFTIIESLVYIFLTTIILVEGISIFVSMYKSYIETAKLTVKYNNCQNFFINLDNIISEGGLEKIIVDNSYVIFSKNEKSSIPDKKINCFEGNIVVKYTKFNITQTINVMLEDVDSIEVRKRGKLIYFSIIDKEGKEFIKCF